MSRIEPELFAGTFERYVKAALRLFFWIMVTAAALAVFAVALCGIWAAVVFAYGLFQF